MFAQHKKQTVRSGLVVEIPMVGITDDGRRNIVSRHNDKAAVEIEGVGRGHAVFSAESVSQIEALHRVFRELGFVLDEIQAQALRPAHIDRLGLERSDA